MPVPAKTKEIWKCESLDKEDQIQLSILAANLIVEMSDQDDLQNYKNVYGKWSYLRDREWSSLSIALRLAGWTSVIEPDIDWDKAWRNVMNKGKDHCSYLNPSKVEILFTKCMEFINEKKQHIRVGQL